MALAALDVAELDGAQERAAEGTLQQEPAPDPFEFQPFNRR